MPDTFHSCEITANGVSIKVLRDGTGHRTALGVGDFKDRDAYVAAVADLLQSHLGENLSVVTANAAADRTYGSEAIAALEADLALLGTKEEAQAMRKAQQRAQKLEMLAALTAELRDEEHDATEATASEELP